MENDRVDASRDRSGTGLGLSIASWIAKAHGGEIRAQSKLGQGTCFTVYIADGDPACNCVTRLTRRSMRPLSGSVPLPARKPDCLAFQQINRREQGEGKLSAKAKKQPGLQG